jgi:hypothetical protein
MAYVANPNYGTLPGAPMRVNWWTPSASPWQLSRFNISDLLATLPPAQSPLTPTVTPQDDAASQGAVNLSTDTGGAQTGGGGPGTGPGGIGGASGGGQDRTTSGIQGVYAQSPIEMDSRFGQAGGLLGMVGGGIGGIPGIGTAAGALGGAIDAARYAGVLNQNGIANNINPWTAALASAMPSIPFTDRGLAGLFGIPSARQQFENELRTNLATVGPTALNTSQPISRIDPVTGEMTVDVAPVAAFDPASLGRDQGYGGALGVMGAPQGQTGYQSGTYVSGIEGGSDPSQAGYGGAPSVGGGAVDPSGGGRGAGGGDTGRDTGFYRGGLIGAPPGRYAAGGMVGGMPTAPGDNISPAAFGALRAINPPGPDDQIGALQTGEGVIRRDAMKRYPGLLDAVNSGVLDPKKVAGLLAPAKRGKALLR